MLKAGKYTAFGFLTVHFHLKPDTIRNLGQTVCHKLICLAHGIYDENVLLDRLFGGYRLVYVGNTTGMGCSFDDEVGKKLFEVSPSEVPSEENFPFESKTTVFEKNPNAFYGKSFTGSRNLFSRPI